jgi:hypothetical protein
MNLIKNIKKSINFESLFEVKKAKMTLKNGYKLNFKKFILYSFLTFDIIYM